MKYLDFVKKVASATACSQSATKQVLDGALDVLKQQLLSGDEVVLNKVGKFSLKVRSARVGINLKTKEKVNIPETKVVAFKMSKEFKEQLNA